MADKQQFPLEAANRHVTQRTALILKENILWMTSRLEITAHAEVFTHSC